MRTLWAEGAREPLETNRKKEHMNRIVLTLLAAFTLLVAATTASASGSATKLAGTVGPGAGAPRGRARPPRQQRTVPRRGGRAGGGRKNPHRGGGGVGGGHRGPPHDKSERLPRP